MLATALCGIVLQNRASHAYSVLYCVLTETPFTLAILRKLPREMFMALVDGGAHLDFRNKAGLTPLHCAAHCGNKVAVQVGLHSPQSIVIVTVT